MCDIFTKETTPLFDLLSQNSHFPLSGNPVPLKSVLDKDSRGPNSFEIRSVV